MSALITNLNVKICSARSLSHRWRHRPFRDRFQAFAIAWVDPNNMFQTKVDINGDRNPRWDETGSISLGGSVDDDTTLYLGIFDDCERTADGLLGDNSLLGAASLKLKEVVNHEGYGVLARRTLDLKRKSGLHHGDVVVEVLIEEPETGQLDEQPPPAQPYGRPPSAEILERVQRLERLMIFRLVSQALEDVKEFIQNVAECFGADF